MKKSYFLFSLLCVAVLSFNLTGCGTQEVEDKKEIASQTIVFEETMDSETTEIEEPEKVEEVEENNEVEATDEVNSDEVIEETTEAEAEEVNETETTDTQTEVVEDTQKFVLPHQDEFWINHYFDIENYLTTCGLSDVSKSLLKISGNCQGWIFEMNTAEEDQSPMLFIHRESETSGFYYQYDYNNPRTKTVIMIDSNETIIHQATVDALEDAIETIYYFEAGSHGPSDLPELNNFIYQ